MQEIKPTFRRSGPTFLPPLAGLTSGVHDPVRGDPEEGEELALKLGQLGIEPLDDATIVARRWARRRHDVRSCFTSRSVMRRETASI